MKTQHSLKNIPIVLLSSFTLLYLGGCVTAQQKALDSGLKPSTNTDLQSLFAEKRTAKFRNTQNGNTGIVDYLPDGSQLAVSKRKTYTGTYTIENNQYCSKMDHRNGEVRVQPGSSLVMKHTICLRIMAP